MLRVGTFIWKSLCHNNGKRHFSNKSIHHKALLTAVLNDWTKKFEAEGVPDASSSAEFITAHVLGKKTLDGVNGDEYILDDVDVAAVNNLSRLRLKRMPVQYIIGEWDFDGMTLKMAPPVFIPRPETEELVGYCKHILKSSQSLREQHPAIIELGCGSGAISLALLKHFKELRSVCVDILPEACALTKCNAQIVGVENRIHIINGDFTHLEVVSQLKLLGPFCLLVSNPPYLTVDELKDLYPEIQRFESVVALSAGVDGLDLVKQILYQAQSLVMPGGNIFLEVGENHPGIIEGCVTKNKDLGLQFIRSMKDLYEKNRFCHLQVTV